MAIEIIPSILSADCARLKEEVDRVAAAGANKVQVDVMDGCFVPNITFGVPVVKALADSTDLILDVHLMIDRPDRYIRSFVDAGADVLTVHVEATQHPHRVLQSIREQGVAVGAALNPGTPLAQLEELISLIDVALVMTVNPGFGGQEFIASMLPKIARLSREIDRQGLDVAIQVDGGIDERTAYSAAAAGATQLVAGSSVYGAGADVREAIRRLKAAAEKGMTDCVERLGEERPSLAQ